MTMTSTLLADPMSDNDGRRPLSLTFICLFQVQLWFGNETEPSSPLDLTEPKYFNRLAALKDGFFLMFADHNQSPLMLNYTSMVSGYVYGSTLAKSYDNMQQQQDININLQ